MKTITQTVFGVLTAFMLVGCATPERQATAWEYKIVSGQVAGQLQLQEEINKAAAEGWIFVSTAGFGERSGYAVMKRPGSASPQLGAAYDREPELRRQLAESVPMKDYGYTIKDLRFTPDYRKALVILPIRTIRRGSTIASTDRIGSLCSRPTTSGVTTARQCNRSTRQALPTHLRFVSQPRSLPNDCAS